jgi:hypothetical protein
MVGHLDLETGLQHVPHQIGQQSALPGERDAVLPGSSDQLLRPLTHRPRLPERHSSSRDAPDSPSLSSCSISVLPPATRAQPAAVRPHQLHKVSDRPPPDASHAAAALAERARRLEGVRAVARPPAAAQRLADQPDRDRHPYSATAQKLVGDLTELTSRYSFYVGGDAAAFRDERNAIASKLPTAIALLAAATLLILFLLSGSLLAPVLALAANALTLAARRVRKLGHHADLQGNHAVPCAGSSRDVRTRRRRGRAHRADEQHARRITHPPRRARPLSSQSTTVASTTAGASARPRRPAPRSVGFSRTPRAPPKPRGRADR